MSIKIVRKIKLPQTEPKKKANNATLLQSSQEVCKNGHGQVAKRLLVVSEVPSRPRCMVIRFVLGKTPAIEGPSFFSTLNPHRTSWPFIFPGNCFGQSAQRRRRHHRGAFRLKHTKLIAKLELNKIWRRKNFPLHDCFLLNFPETHFRSMKWRKTRCKTITTKSTSLSGAPSIKPSSVKSPQARRSRQDWAA